MLLASPSSLPRPERPREKLQLKGPAALTSQELVQVVLGAGVKGANVTQIAQQVVSLIVNNELSLASLLKVRGLSLAKASVILAAVELSVRLKGKDDTIVQDPADILPLVSEYRNKRQEYLICFTLDGANRLLQQRVISIGTLTNTLIHPREVFADAITDRAASIILVHNHPSGNPEPSSEDMQVTAALVKAGRILGIELHDHIIIAQGGWFSFRSNGLV
jgi:DNA repair protein RadC